MNFPNLKWSTVNDWKTAITDDMKKTHGEGNFEPITMLEDETLEDLPYFRTS